MRHWLATIEIYFKRPIIAQFFLGIPSGLPLALTASTLAVWLTESGVSKSAIGIFAAVAVPYSLKFLWAPFMDGSRFPLIGAWLGKRRSWMVATQLAMVVILLLMGAADPAKVPVLTGFYALLLAFASASHDIVKDAYRVEILPTELQGAGSASFVLGYRVGNLFSTAGALYLASYVSWQATYGVMALVLAALTAMLLFIREPVTVARESARPKMREWIHDYVVTPFVEFFARPHAVMILLFILLYRMADAFLGVMASPFYIELGFTKIQIAEMVKLYGLLATIIGSIIGGIVVFRLGVIRSLWIGGIAASISNLMFVWQEHVGAEPYALALTISLDNLSGGLATSAFVAYMSELCNKRFTATQYALLSSLAAFGRTWLSTPSGFAAEYLGWDGFFYLSTVIGIPPLLVLWWLSVRATSPPAASTSK